MANPIRFQALVSKIASSRDGGWVISFEVSDSERNAMFLLSGFREDLVTLEVAPEIHIPKPDIQDHSILEYTGELQSGLSEGADGG